MKCQVTLHCVSILCQLSPQESCLFIRRLERQRLRASAWQQGQSLWLKTMPASLACSPSVSLCKRLRVSAWPLGLSQWLECFSSRVLPVQPASRLSRDFASPNYHRICLRGISINLANRSALCMPSLVEFPVKCQSMRLNSRNTIESVKCGMVCGIVMSTMRNRVKLKYPMHAN